MAVPEWLLDMLVCPERKGIKLFRAESKTLAELNKHILRRKIFDRGGRLVEGILTEGLIREDGQVLYPVIDGIPRLCLEDGIEIAQVRSTQRRVS